MAVSSENPKRRSRYQRQPQAGRPALTPIKQELLVSLARVPLASLPQLARLGGLTEKMARWHLRPLFDAGLIETIALPRSVLAEPEEARDPALLYGSAPNIYQLSRKGHELLLVSELIDATDVPTRYGPQNWLFIRHELLVTEVYVWLTCCAQARPGQALCVWRQGQAAAIDLKRTVTPAMVKPDAWFTFSLASDGAVLVGMVEADRGTERGTALGSRWLQKIEAYAALFASGRLKEVTGYRNARILILTPTAARRDSLAALLAERAAPGLAGRCWLAQKEVLAGKDIAAALWRQPASPGLQPLLVLPPSSGEKGA